MPDSVPSATAAVGPAVYDIADLGRGEALALNDDGAVVGSADGPNGFLYQHGQTTNLGPEFASGISNAGTIIGGKRGTGPGGNSWGISGDGTAVVGSTPQAGLVDPAYGQVGYPGIWTESTGWQSLYNLGCRLPGVWSGLAFGVQNKAPGSKGMVVGQAISGPVEGPATGRAFRCIPDGTGAYKAFELNLPGATDGAAYAINQVGQIAGKSDSLATPIQAYRWGADGVPQALGFAPYGHVPPAPLLDQSVAYGINAAGDVVGSYGPIASSPTLEAGSINNRAFIWRNGDMQDLTDLLGPNTAGWVLNLATAINKRGQIVGQGTINGQQHAFLLSPGGVDVIADRVVVTQSVQNEENLDLLVRGKQAYAIVRAHSDKNTAYGVTAILHGTGDGADLGDIPPITPRADIVNKPDPTNMHQAFLFALPPSWSGHKTLTLKAKVNPDFAAKGDDPRNNETTATVTLNDAPSLNVDVVNANIKGDTAAKSAVYQSSYGSLSRFIGTSFPIASLGGRHYPTQLEVTPRAGYADRCGAMLLGVLDILPWLKVDKGTILYALAGRQDGSPPYGDPDTTGCSWVPSPVATGWTGFKSNMTAAHEIAHAIGRNHVPVCGAGGLGDKPAYPSIGANSAPVNAGSLHQKSFALNGDMDLAFDGSSLLPAKTPQEIMTYCWNDSTLPESAGWVSDYTYENLFRLIPDVGKPRALGSLDRSVTAGTDVLHIVGSIDLSQEKANFSIARYLQPVSSSYDAVGPYHLRLFDQSNQPLSDVRFTPNGLGPAGGEVPQSLVDQVVPFVPGTVRVSIYSDLAAKEIASAPVSANSPNVTITSPAPGAVISPSGTVTVSWSGLDADNDSLTYSVLYSNNDGTSWQPLAEGITENSITLDAAELPGGTAVRIKVIANDGANTGTAEIRGLNVPVKPAAVSIDAPADGASYTTDQAVLFQGSADDPQDGNLKDAGLVWSSDKDGQLGTGSSVLATKLSVGTHIITFSATDSAGLTASKSIHITVSAGQPGPALGLSTSTLNFPFDASTNPTSQPLSIDNLGSGDLSWTASSDDPRVTLDVNSGSAPATLNVAINTQGLTTGRPFQAHVTVTAPGVANGTQIVNVTAESTDPTLGFSTQSIDFGSQLLSAPPQTTAVTLTFHGAGSLQLAGVTLAGAAPQEFTLSNDTCSNTSLVTGASCTINAGFHPGKAGQGTAYLVASASNADRWYLPLTGLATGIPQSAGLLGWGDDSFGQAGSTPPSTPCHCLPLPGSVSGLPQVAAVSSGDTHGLALDTNGNPWTWGQNCGGTMGNGTYGDCVTANPPQQVAGVSGLTSIAAGSGYSLAVKGDGTVWSWGTDGSKNGFGSGALGRGGNRYIPGEVNDPSGAGFLDHVVAVAAGTSPSSGGASSYALGADGTVWMWGSLGVGTNNNTLGPVQIPGPSGQGALSGITAIAHGMALRSDGTVWTWGDGGDGQLGNGTTTAQTQNPVQVLDPTGTKPLTGVVAIASRENQRYALNGDGTVFAWGSGRSSTYATLDAGVALGIGGQHPNGVALPTPVSGPDGTGSLTSVTAIQPGLALRTDGTVWAWGRGATGALGNGTYLLNPWAAQDPEAGSPSPVQVHGVGGIGYLSGISAIAGGETRFAVPTTGSSTPGTLTAGTPVNLSATEGTTTVPTVGSFSDSDPAATAQTFSASIDWGDGTTATSGVVTGGNGTFNVTGAHSYAATGSYNLSIVITDTAGNALALTATAAIADAALAPGPPFKLQAVEGEPCSVTGTFSDTATTAAESNFVAAVDWGDGTPAEYTAVTGPPGGPFNVSAIHSFASARSYSVTIRVADKDGSITSMRGTAEIADAPLTPAASYTTSAAQGNSFNGPLASFTDSNPDTSITDFSAVVDWGDGSASAGTIQGDGNGAITVSGNHTYAATTDAKTVTVKLTDSGGSTSTSSTTVMAHYPHASLTETVDHASGPAPFTALFTYQLTNDGQDNLFQLKVAGSLCGDASYATGDNGDGILEPGENWTFTCQHSFDSPGPLTDTSVADALDFSSGLGILSSKSTATITVTAPLDHLVLVPGTSSTEAGTSVTYRAEGFDAAGNELGDLTATTSFTIFPDGSCTGNACTATVAGNHTVKGTNNGKTGTANLTVVGATLDHLGLTPTDSAVKTGVGQPYAAEGYDRYNNDLGNVTDTTVFTITPDGNCTNSTCVANIPGPHTVTASKAGTTPVTAKLLVYGVASGGTFVIAGPATTGSEATFWDDQWAQKNGVKTAVSPSQFKGFANSTSNAICGGTWTANPGNRSRPPAQIPTYMLVIVTSQLSQQGAQITGNVVHLVVVQVDPGYATDPGHSGTGTIVRVLC